MAIPYLTLTDDGNNVYSFPLDFWISDSPLETTKNIINFSYNAGGKNVSDGFPQARLITITGAVRADSLASLETKERALYFACLKGGKLKKTDDTVSRYIDVRDPSFSISQGTYRQEMQVSITFFCKDSFWRDTTETIDSQTVAGNANLSIDNSGSDWLVNPVIEIENDQGVDNIDLNMTQQSDGSMIFVYTDPNFVSGDTLIIDCQNGTVERNGNNSIVYFDTARFFRLQPIVNTIVYNGAACTIRFKFRKVYV